MSKASIVLGLLFGDEGKGSIVSWCIKNAKEKSIVIRFGGGSQCGHTVINSGIRHVFSSIGSGTIRGAPTYISKYCSINPLSLYNEIQKLGKIPKIYIDKNAKVITPMDLVYDEKVSSPYMTTNQGIGMTTKRNEEYFHLYYRDLLYSYVYTGKLDEIIAYYQKRGIKYKAKVRKDFNKAVKFIVKNCIFVDGITELPEFEEYIFEGHQGILLDQHYGFFPYVTRANTTSKNAQELLRELQIEPEETDIYLVLRAYMTKHGAGKIPNREGDLKNLIKKNPKETNIYNDAQGVFHIISHSTELLKYAISCEKYNNPIKRMHFVITCLDQTNHKMILDYKAIDVEKFVTKIFPDVTSIVESTSEEGPK